MEYLDEIINLRIKPSDKQKLTASEAYVRQSVRFGLLQSKIDKRIKIGIKELLSNEDMITLALIHKAKKRDVSAYKSAHGFGLCSSQTKLRINRIRTANI